MNRRELLGAAAVAPLAAVIPIGTEAETLNAKRLMARIERKFRCLDGPPRSYFEGVDTSGQFGRGIYQTFVNGVATTDGQAVTGLDTEALALDALWRSFSAYAIGKTGRLYWRKRPTVHATTLEEEMETRDLVEASPGLYHYRIAVEDDLNYTPQSPEAWGYTGPKYYARMRLVITDVMPLIEEDYDGMFRIDSSGDVWQRRGKVEV